MDGLLLRVLISKKLFRKGIEVDIRYKGYDLSGSALVDSTATLTVLATRPIGENEVALEGSNIVDGTRKIFYAQSMTKIDGMDPERFARSFGISGDGSKIKEGKRRGRKPKNRPVESGVEELTTLSIS